MEIVDGHSHMYQTFAPSDRLKKSTRDIEGFDIQVLVKQMDESCILRLQTMPQEMTRKRGEWLGSNELAADIQRSAPERLVSFAAAEPVDGHDAFNRTRFLEVRQAIYEWKLNGLLLTPPYGHYYATDRQVYPFYEMAVEARIPVYFHHSHQYGDARDCPLKYARVSILDDLIIDFPDLRFNVEHMGYPWTEELLSMMSRSPNVYTDIAMFVQPYGMGVGRHLMLARNLGMARDYGVLDRVFYGSDYVGESVDEYIHLVQREIAYLEHDLNRDMERLGYPPLTREEMEGLMSRNVLKLWQG